MCFACFSPQPPPDFSKVEIKTTQIADNFYTLEGLGGTISVLTGPDGVLLVDSQFAALTDKLVAALVAQNKTLEEVIAAKPTVDFDAQVPQSLQTAERFVTWMYTEVKAGH